VYSSGRAGDRTGPHRSDNVHGTATWAPFPDVRRVGTHLAKGLETALSDGSWNHLASQLPEDYADLLGTEPVQKH
jgi:hypothetical protein